VNNRFIEDQIRIVDGLLDKAEAHGDASEQQSLYRRREALVEASTRLTEPAHAIGRAVALWIDSKCGEEEAEAMEAISHEGMGNTINDLVESIWMKDYEDLTMSDRVALIGSYMQEDILEFVRGEVVNIYAGK